MKAVWNGTTIAESDETIVVEGNHYFPRSAVHERYFRDSQRHSVCSWKGTASYLHVSVDGTDNPDAAWYYPEPLAAAGEIAGHVAFWRGVDVVPS